MIRGSVQQEDTIMLNVYIPNNRTAKYVKQKLAELKGEIGRSTIIVGDFNILLSTVDKPLDRKSPRMQNSATSSTNRIVIFVEHSAQRQKNTHSVHAHRTYIK